MLTEQIEEQEKKVHLSSNRLIILLIISIKSDQYVSSILLFKSTFSIDFND